MAQTTQTPPPQTAETKRTNIEKAIWRATFADYRTSRYSDMHPGVMMLDEQGVTTLTPLRTLSDEKLAALAARKGL